MGAIATLLALVAITGIWVICLFEILSGNALETFRLGTVVTGKTALHATYLDVFIGDTLAFLVVVGGGIAHYLRHREEQDFLEKYRVFSKDRRIAWRQKHFPKRKGRNE